MTTTETRPLPSSAVKTRRGRVSVVPYLLIVPCLLVLAVITAWPLVKIVILSLQQQPAGKFALFHSGSTPFVWFQNYGKVLSDPTFWTVVLRTLVFTVICVTVSVVLGLGIALLLNRVSNWARILLTTVLLFCWAVPSTVSTQIFYWLFSSQYGVANYVLDKLPGVNLQGHDWFANPTQGLAVVIIVVVWGAIPLLAISLHAGLTQIPKEVLEAAQIDGSGRWKTLRYLIFPYLAPLLTILTTLSIIWDFGVFNQIWFMRNGHPEPGYQTVGIYMYTQGVGSSHYNTGATVGVLMMVMLLLVMVFYIRQLFRASDS